MPSIEAPEETTPTLRSRGRSLLQRGGRVFGLGLLTLVAFLFFKGMADPYGFLAVDPGLLFAIALVGAGVLLLRGQEATDQVTRGVRAPRKRSPLGVLTLAAVFCACGVLLLLSNLSVDEIGIGQIAAAALLVVGLGLVAGAWWGRSRWLIAVGVLLLPLVIVTGFIPFPLRGAVGDRFVNVRSIEQVEDSYDILAGGLQLDLMRVNDFSGVHELDVQVAAGQVTIYLPERVGLTVDGRIELGNATVGRGRESGEDVAFRNELEGKPGAGELHLNFRGGIASLYVERISHEERFGFTARERREQRRLERLEAEREERLRRQRLRKERKEKRLRQELRELRREIRAIRRRNDG